VTDFWNNRYKKKDRYELDYPFSFIPTLYENYRLKKFIVKGIFRCISRTKGNAAPMSDRIPPVQ